MTPKQYEEYIGSLFIQKGYTVTVSPLSNDWGLDVIAIKDNEKIGIQAKMYGESSRSVNRRAIMELYGASAYQDCNRTILATNGDILSDAIAGANKLGIKLSVLQRRYVTPDYINQMIKAFRKRIILIVSYRLMKPGRDILFRSMGGLYIILVAQITLLLLIGPGLKELHLMAKLAELTLKDSDWHITYFYHRGKYHVIISTNR